jgi:chitin disaccharide deacetylase
MKKVVLTCLMAAAAALVGAASFAAETKGLEKGKKYLIIHADDAGMCHSENLATFDAMEHGIVSSASIMVPCPWFKEAAEYAVKHADKDFGVHLTLNCEWHSYRWGPVAPKDKVPSLLDEEGYLWSSVEQVAKHAKTEEVEIELRAQIERAKQFGVPITHLDTHMGSVLARPEIVQVYVKLGLEYNIPILFMRDPTPLREENPALLQYVDQIAAALAAKGLPVLDTIGQFYSADTLAQRYQNYENFLKAVKPGVSQLIIHCGYNNAELAAVTDSAKGRDGDRRIFTDPKIKALVKKLGIEVITWKQFRAMASVK